MSITFPSADRGDFESFGYIPKIGEVFDPSIFGREIRQKCGVTIIDEDGDEILETHENPKREEEAEDRGHGKRRPELGDLNEGGYRKGMPELGLPLPSIQERGRESTNTAIDPSLKVPRIKSPWEIPNGEA